LSLLLDYHGHQLNHSLIFLQGYSDLFRSSHDAPCLRYNLGEYMLISDLSIDIAANLPFYSVSSVFLGA